MAVVIKSEWHQVEKRYAFEIDREKFGEIYSDIEDEGEIDLMFLQFENGELDLEEVFQKAWNDSVDIDWEWLDEDDWWTDRKGGYEVTFDLEK